MSLTRPERGILLAFLVLLVLAGGWALWPWRKPPVPEPAPAGEGAASLPAEETAGPPAGEGGGNALPDVAAAGGEAGAPSDGARPGAAVVIHVAGAVASPGVYTLREGQRVADAVTAAGGGTGDARLDLVNLAARLEDGEKIYIPSVKDALAGGGGPPLWEGGGGAGPGVPAKVSLNRADVAELDSLPGIGPALAQRIVDYRRSHGPFRRIEDIQQVPGIGPAKFQDIRARLTLN